MKKTAALGFRAHSGWASLVVLVGPARAPEVADRRRIDLADARVPWSKQPFHAAAELELSEAAKLVRGARTQSRMLARRALHAVCKQVRVNGCVPVAGAILLGSGRAAADLAAALASHTQIHTAEGELFREAIAHACSRQKLRVVGVKEKGIYSRAATELRLAQGELRARLETIGKALGPPWRQDEKLAALAAWVALKSRA